MFKHFHVKNHLIVVRGCLESSKNLLDSLDEDKQEYIFTNASKTIDKNSESFTLSDFKPNENTFENITVYDFSLTCLVQNELKSDELITQSVTLVIPVDDADKISYSCLTSKLKEHLKMTKDSMNEYNVQLNQLEAHYFHVENGLLLVFYPLSFHEKEIVIREKLQEKHSLDPSTLHRTECFIKPAYLLKELGPSEEILVNPHDLVKGIHEMDNLFVIQGRYAYKHYMQDGVDDKGWGCAYRSMQTIISWLLWQNYIPFTTIPTLREIQEELVKIGDKKDDFIGSKNWIGSLEISFLLQSKYNVDCRILPLRGPKEIESKASQELAEHFDAGGGPVMIGGGQFAHTIIGVQITDKKTKFLILDPHYNGPFCDRDKIISEGWVGWKEVSFWKANTPYNLCFPPLFSDPCM